MVNRGIQSFVDYGEIRRFIWGVMGWMEGYGIYILKCLMMEGVVLFWIMDFLGIFVI